MENGNIYKIIVCIRGKPRLKTKTLNQPHSIKFRKNKNR